MIHLPTARNFHRFLNHNSTVSRMPNIWTTYHICIVDYMPTIYHYNSLYTPEFSIILLCPWGPSFLAMIFLVSTHLNIWKIDLSDIWTQLGLITFSSEARVTKSAWDGQFREFRISFDQGIIGRARRISMNLQPESTEPPPGDVCWLIKPLPSSKLT